MLEIDEILREKYLVKFTKKKKKRDKTTLTPKSKPKIITKFVNELMKMALSKSRFEQKRASKKM